MIRRSRLSVRPNVGTLGKTAGSLQETSSNKDQDKAEIKIEAPASVTDSRSTDPSTEQTPGSGQNGDSASSLAIQRRKRFSVRPKVIPGRPSALPRTPKSPIKPVLPIVKSPTPVNDRAEKIIEESAAALEQELCVPKEPQPSVEDRLSQDSLSPSEGSRKCMDQPGKVKSPSSSQVNEVPPKAPVPPSIPEREASDISDKAKTLVSKTELADSSRRFSLTQLLNDKSDLLRLEKARKLRQLLKQEMLKEKGKKQKARVKEFSIDPSKMTMRDLIHYLPTSNPMSSALEESAQENETIVPPSPERERSPERAPEQDVQPKTLSPGHREPIATTSAEAEQEDEDAEDAAEDEDELMVPQVKVAEDGSLIIDEESLTVEVQRMKGPNPIQDRDPIFERGSTTTYSSFRKSTHTKPWSPEETDMFFLAINMVGTDFAMISQLFPDRARSEIKNKFKKEEKHNAWRIDKAFKERRKLDLEYFKKLLEKILEYQQSKKKLKAMSEKPKTTRRKRKGKKAVTELSDVEENEDGESFAEQEGEKENRCEEKSSSKPKSKRKRVVHSPDSQVGKKKKKREELELSDKADALTDADDVAVPDDHQSVDQSEKTETQVAKPTEEKSGEPSPLGRKGRKGKKSKELQSSSGGETGGQIEHDDVLSAKRASDNDSSDHETPVPTARQSRCGRISKPVQPLNYPAKEDPSSSASPSHQRAAAKSKNKTNGKRRSPKQKITKEPKKTKLITLRASQSEGSVDDDDDDEADAQQCDDNDDENSTSAFVPASLCSPKPVVQKVQETMEELDILAHIPDVLGMSKMAMCPEASCKQVQSEQDTLEPYEHHLDLLVDVIDFISEGTEASEEESYNEAAQTLLEIGNLANLSQLTKTQASLLEDISNVEGDHHSGLDVSESPFEPEGCSGLVSGTSEAEIVPTSIPNEQPQTSFTSESQPFAARGDFCNTEDSSSCVQASPPRPEASLPPRKSRLFKLKPKPNVGSSSRSSKLLSRATDTVIEVQQNVETSPYQSSEQLKESISGISEHPKTEITPADTTPKPTSHVNSEQYCELDYVKSLPVRAREDESAQAVSDQDFSYNTQESPTTPPEPLSGADLSPPTRKTQSKRSPKPEKISSHALVHGVEQKTLEHQVETTETVSEQLNSQNEMLFIPTLQTADELHDEPNTSEEGAANSHHETCSRNASLPRKGRFSKIKPKPNVGSASRSTKLFSRSADKQTGGEVGSTRQKQSVVPPLSESEVDSHSGLNKTFSTGNSEANETDLSNGINLTQCGIHGQQKQEGQFTEVSSTPSRQGIVEPAEKVNTVATSEPEMTPSPQSHSCPTPEKAGLIIPVLLDPSSDHFTHSTPQRRQAIPKAKFKPVLVMTPRTAKSRFESKGKTQTPEQPVKSKMLIATSEHSIPQVGTTAQPCDYLQTVNLEPNTSLQVVHVHNFNKQSDSKSAKAVPQLEDLTQKNKETCRTSKTQLETSETSADHPQTAEGALESSNDPLPADSASNLDPVKRKDSSVQSSSEYNSLLLSNVPSGQHPSDPDEPFFILSLTEIPVFPLALEVKLRPGSSSAEAQRSNPSGPAMPLAAGIDDSLSNIHIPTPEKATLKSQVICLEKYLPATPSLDISLPEAPQVSPSIREMNLPEFEDDVHSLSEDKPLSPKGDAQEKSNQSNLRRKGNARNTKTCKKGTNQEQQESLTEIQSREMNIRGAQKSTHGPSVISQIKKPETRGKKSQTIHSEIPQSSGDSVANASTGLFTSKDNQPHCSSQLLALSLTDSSNDRDDGPNNISEFFISDVFTDVEDDCPVTGNKTEDTAPRDKTPSPPPAVKTNQSSSAAETTVHSSQKDGKKSRGKVKAKRKNITFDDGIEENSRPRRKMTATKVLETLPLDSGCTEICANPSDSTVEVVRGSSSVSRTRNNGKKTQTSSANTRGKRKTKAVSPNPLVTPEPEREASVTHEEKNNPVDPNSSNGKTQGLNETTAATSRQKIVASKSSARARPAPPDRSSTAHMAHQAKSPTGSTEAPLSDNEPTNVSQYFFSDIFTDSGDDVKL